MEKPPDLEQAATALLERSLAIAGRHLRASQDHERDGTLLRATLHIRSGSGYRALIMVEAPSEPHGRRPEATLVSSSAWEEVQRSGAAVVVDVTLREVRPLHQLPDPSGSSTAASMSHLSQELMLDHGATHLLALPLRAGDRTLGMVTLELHSLRSIGASIETWVVAEPELQALLDDGFPALQALESAPVIGPDDPGLPVVGRSMAPVLRTLKTAARFDDILLLTGESGVGKSRMARWVHQRSARARGPFEHVHLQTMPETLVDGELFGWVKGAHDGAHADRDGYLARAEGGTLFLDEIDKVSPNIQKKLLHLVDTRGWRPLGSSKGERTANVRFIVGTNASLEREVQAGRFLSDLFWRINVLPVRIPSLAERQDEIRGWAEFFLRRKHEKETGRGDARFSEAALALLHGRAWPGNLRQLDQAVIRAWLICADVDANAPLLIDSTSLRAALAFDGQAGQPALDAALRQAASAFVHELQARAAEGSRPLTLDHADAFRGYVLAELESRVGGVKEAYTALGMESLVRSNNHQAARKREMARTKALWGKE